MKRFNGIEFAGDAFREVLGHCIAIWSEIEEELFSICEISMRTNRKVVAIVYYRTPTLKGRLELTSELIRSIFPPKIPGAHDSYLIQVWDGNKGLSKLIDGELSIRNRIAHQPILKVEFGEAIMLKDGTSCAFYFPQTNQSESELLRGKQIKNCLLINDLKDHFWRCDKIIDELKKFRVDLQKYILENS